jgi:hypothetical protein
MFRRRGEAMYETTAIIRTSALAIILGVLSGLAVAQQRSREDNIWGGKAHQPTESQVVQQERSAGIAPPPQEQTRTNDEVEDLYRNLMQGEPRG